jgi:hypothetical protein
MSETRWLGPYAPNERHADPVTIDHIIKLKREINDLLSLNADLVAEIEILREELTEQGKQNEFLRGLA